MSDAIFEHLKTALSHLAKGDLQAMVDHLKQPAFGEELKTLGEKAEAAGGIGEEALALKDTKRLLHLLDHTSHPAAAKHIKEIAADALAKLSEGGLTQGINDAGNILEWRLTHLDGVRKIQAAALKAGEAAHFEKVGPVRYAIDLAKRRWSADGNFLESTSDKLGEALHAVEDAVCDHGHDHGHAHHHTHEVANPNAIKPNANALEEFGNVKLLKTNAQKLAVAGGSVVGVGLVLHGGLNVAKGLRGDAEPDLEISDLGQEPKHTSGTNWTRLFVGLGEMAAGAALAYRVLTGRMAVRSPVDGKVKTIMSHCTHGHHIGA